MQRHYLAIDGKSFYASAECADRGLDPLTTNLVVADESKTDKTICLAVSPPLKALGISGRSRLFEVRQRVELANEERLRKAPGHTFCGISSDACELKKNPALEIGFIIAPPRMARYIEVAAEIYRIYLNYIAPEDIFPYSIDESFMDITAYLDTYRKTPKELAMNMIKQVLDETGITATCGIGTNMYLAKIAMDIVAKKAAPDENGVRIAALDETSYRRLLWDHKPLTDFWRIGKGTAAKLEHNGIYTMGDLARMSLYNEEWFYKTFGIDAEILIDHAWGIEPTLMSHVQNYKPSESSICEGQVLSMPYTYDKAKIIIREMAENVMLQLCDRKCITDSLTLDIGYDIENCAKSSYTGETKTDHYGRLVPKPAHGSTTLLQPTNLGSQLICACEELFEKIADPSLTIRRITITAGRIEPEGDFSQLDLFTDISKTEKEKNLQDAMLQIKKRFGKNAILRGTSYTDGATGRQRNQSIGGHHE